MRNQNIVDSFNAAIEGFLYVVKTQRNMRVHFLFAVFVVLLGLRLNFKRSDMMILCLTISVVLITEMFNTAMEIALDFLRPVKSPLVRRMKDISAAAVLIASINAVIVGYMLFFHNEVVHALYTQHILRLSRSEWHISFFILLILIGIVIFGKTFFHKGTPLRGGMPSGHAAVAFSIWTLVALISKSSFLTFIVFILAVMIAQSRINRHYHTLLEVVVGSGIGITVTLLLYRLLGG